LNGKLWNEKVPAPSVVCERVYPVAGLAMDTVAPGIAAPLASFTVPLTVPDVLCAGLTAQHVPKTPSGTTIALRQDFNRMEIPPKSGVAGI
jgi:hypothetical protein